MKKLCVRLRGVQNELYEVIWPLRRQDNRSAEQDALLDAYERAADYIDGALDWLEGIYQAEERDD